MTNKAIFLDRDDTLIEDPGYINHPDQVHLLEGIPQALAQFKIMGYKLVVVTNQSGVARGIVTEKVLKEIHQRLADQLAEYEVVLDKIYYCPYHEDGVIEKYRKASGWRKPSPGMLLAAARDMDLDLAACWCIGNSDSDMEAGRRAGCRTILIDAMSPAGHQHGADAGPEFVAVNMREALNIVKKHRHPPVAPPLPTAEPTPVWEEPAPAVNPAASVDEEVPDAEPPVESRFDQQVPDADSAPPQLTTEDYLQTITEQLRALQRDELFDEFSLVRLVAGVAQIVVVFCLLIAVWFLLTPERPYNPVYTALGFAVVFQIMALSLSIHGRK